MSSDKNSDTELPEWSTAILYDDWGGGEEILAREHSKK